MKKTINIHPKQYVICRNIFNEFFLTRSRTFRINLGLSLILRIFHENFVYILQQPCPNNTQAHRPRIHSAVFCCKPSNYPPNHATSIPFLPALRSIHLSTLHSLNHQQILQNLFRIPHSARCTFRCKLQLCNLSLCTSFPIHPRRHSNLSSKHTPTHSFPSTISCILCIYLCLGDTLRSFLPIHEVLNLSKYPFYLLSRSLSLSIYIHCYIQRIHLFVD